MYSGFILVYGFKTTLEILSNIFEKSFDEEVNDYEFQELINDILEKKGYKFINIHYQRCCYHNENEVFLGVCLGHTSFVYRDNVETFTTFETYNQKYQQQLDEIKQEYTENQYKILNEFKNLANEYNLENLQPNLEFYTFANDCESCT